MRAKEACTPRSNERGLSIIEVLVASSLALIVAMISYQFLEYSRRSFLIQNDYATAQATGRAVIEMLSVEIESAGYSPRGVAFDSVAEETQTRIRVQADFDGDGVVVGVDEDDENVIFEVEGPDADGLFTLYRRVDVDGDGTYDDPGDSEIELTARLVQVDYDRDGVDDDFLGYDAAAPDTQLVTLTFGVRSEHRDPRTKKYTILPYQVELRLRNQA